MCPSVGEFLKNGESDLSRIWLAHADLWNGASELNRIQTARSRRRRVCAERVVYCGRRWQTEDIFRDIRVLKKYAHSRLPVYDRRRADVCNAPVLRNASNVFEETTFNGTVEMARVGIRYIRGTDYPGKYCT